MTKDEARAAFAEMVARDESIIELDRAALLIAAEEYPQLNIEVYLLRLEAFADQARILDNPKDDPVDRITTLSRFMFDERGFHGNTENYFDARNSFLNIVIDRRTGIPITLSVIYLELARRIGLRLSGVAMPGHFIVKYDENGEEIFIDPFNGGRLISEEKCREMVREMYGGTVQFHPFFLRAVTKRQIIARMLQNLKGLYTRAEDHHKTLAVIERLLLINPNAASEIRDRGKVNYSLGRYTQSLADLELYLQLAPQADDVKEIKEKIAGLMRKRAELN